MNAMIEHLEPRLLMSGSYLLGDLNHDTRVDFGDIIKFSQYYEKRKWREIDLNHDMMIDMKDWQIMLGLANFKPIIVTQLNPPPISALKPPLSSRIPFASHAATQAL